ncbi:MAG: haloacid dehalogenase type II [Fidelibacterota bacterium]
MLNFENYEVLTFDCYGTLIDWESGILSAMKRILTTHHVELEDRAILEQVATLEARAEGGAFQDYKSVLKKVVDGFASEFHFDPATDEEKLLGESLKKWEPFPDTVDALRVLKKKYKLAILSNVDDDLFSLSARRLKVEFDWVITAQQVRSYKPSLNNFRYAIREIGAPKKRVLHVAQSIYHDIIPAHRSGLSTVWVNRQPSRMRLDTWPIAYPRPDVEVPNLKSLVGEAGLR